MRPSGVLTAFPEFISFNAFSKKIKKWSIKLLKLLHISFLILLLPKAVMSAACCGGGFAIPSLITGDDKAQLTTSYSYSKIHTDVFSNGIWQRRNSTDASTVYKIEGAHIFADRYQAGFSLPIQTRNLDGAQGGSSTGLGDVSGQLGYEYLPDWNYSPWRPRGIGFISLTLPTGKSIYESTTGLDSRGRGFFCFRPRNYTYKNMDEVGC